MDETKQEKQIHQFDQAPDAKEEQAARKKYQKVFWAIIIASALTFLIFDTILVMHIINR